MRNEVFSTNPLRLNAIREEIQGADESDHAPVSELSTNSQRERKKVAKKERESTTATIFVSKTGNSNCRQREIIIDAGHDGLISGEKFLKSGSGRKPE